MDKEGRFAKRPRSAGDKPQVGDVRSSPGKKGVGAAEKTVKVVKEPAIGLISQTSSSTATAFNNQQGSRFISSRPGRGPTPRDGNRSGKPNSFSKGLPPVPPRPHSRPIRPSAFEESQGFFEGSQTNSTYTSGVIRAPMGRDPNPPLQSVMIRRQLDSVVDHIQEWQMEQYNNRNLFSPRSSSMMGGPGPSRNYGTGRSGYSFNYYYDNYFGNEPSSEFARFGEPKTPERTWETTTLGRNVGPQMESAHRIPTEDGIRFSVMSYNVLSPKLAETHAYLYNDVDPKALKWENRKKAFFQEIATFKPDILCLQEVEESLFVPIYKEEFKTLGYTGVFKKRTRDKEEGCAIFFSSKKFRLLDKLTVEFYQPHIPLLNRDNVAILVKLEVKNARSGNKLVVGTTHLLFNPRRHDVKLAQTQLLLAELDRFACSGVDANLNPMYYPTILTGDFNTEPYSPITKLLAYGNLPHCDQNGQPIKCLKRRGQDQFMPPHLGISDQCQHYQVVNERLLLRKKKKSNFFEMHSNESTKFTAILNSEDPTKKFRSGATDLPNTPAAVSAQSSMSAFYQNPKSTMSVENSTVALSTRPSSMLEFADGDISHDVIDRIVTTAAPYVDIEILENILREGILCTFGSGELSHRFFLKDVYASKLDGQRSAEGIATTKQNGWVCVDYIFYSSIWHDKFGKQIEGKLKLIRRLSLLSRSQCKELGSLPREDVPSDHYPLLAEFMLKN